MDSEILSSVKLLHNSIQDYRVEHDMKVFEKEYARFTSIHGEAKIDKNKLVHYSLHGKKCKSKVGRFLSKQCRFNEYEDSRLETANILLTAASVLKYENYYLTEAKGEDLMEAFKAEVGIHTCMTGNNSIFMQLLANNPRHVKLLIFTVPGTNSCRALLWKTKNKKLVLDRLYPGYSVTAMALRMYALKQGWGIRKLFQPLDIGTNVSISGLGKEEVSLALPKNYSIRIPTKKKIYYPYLDTFTYGTEIRNGKSKPNRILLSNYFTPEGEEGQSDYSFTSPLGAINTLVNRLTESKKEKRSRLAEEKRQRLYFKKLRKRDKRVARRPSTNEGEYIIPHSASTPFSNAHYRTCLVNLIGDNPSLAPNLYALIVELLTVDTTTINDLIDTCNLIDNGAFTYFRNHTNFNSDYPFGLYTGVFSMYNHVHTCHCSSCLSLRNVLLNLLEASNTIHNNPLYTTVLVARNECECTACARASAYISDLRSIYNSDANYVHYLTHRRYGSTHLFSPELEDCNFYNNTGRLHNE